MGEVISFPEPTNREIRDTLHIIISELMKIQKEHVVLIETYVQALEFLSKMKVEET